MSSDSNFKHLKYGLNLVPNATTLIFAPGDIDYSTDTGKFNFYGAGGSSPGVTESGVQTLTNKTLLVGSNTITGTINTAAQFNATTGSLESSITTAAELAFVHGVTSSIQTQLNGKQSSLTFADSLVNTSGTVTLVGDTASPTATQYYGTNSSSILGYYNIPATGVTSVTASGPLTSSGGNTPNISFTGTLGFANGGTNATTSAAAFNNLSPMTTTGDMEYESAPGVASRLAIGSTNQVLKVTGGIPTWATFTALTNPMTTTGDIIYSSDGLGTPARLGIGSTGQILEVVSGLPTWTTPLSPFFAASSQVTTASSAVSSGTFTTFSNSPALTFTPTVTGTYKVYSSVVIEGTSGGDSKIRIFNTSGGATLLYESQAAAAVTGTAYDNTLYIESVYTLTAGTSYVFDIQGASSATVAIEATVAPFYMFAELEVAGTAPVTPSILVFTSTATVGGAATEAVTVTGLLATDTILSVSQKTQGSANLPILGWSTQINNGISLIYVADMGPGAIVLVAVSR